MVVILAPVLETLAPPRAGRESSAVLSIVGFGFEKFRPLLASLLSIRHEQ